MPSFYEFFAGGGMARAGLGKGWTCLFANDFDAKKGLTYQLNWGTGGELRICDVRSIKAPELPGQADLSGARSPARICRSQAAARGSRVSDLEPSIPFGPC